jgi:hypothetical protein
MWLETTFSKREPVSLSWVVILAFLHDRQGFRTFFHIELRSRFKTQRILRRALVSSSVGVRFWDHRVRT